MPKGVQLLSAMAFDKHTFDTEYFADPIIRVLGELPALSQPFQLDRVYKGPQGIVEEVIYLLDPTGKVIWERSGKHLELRGMMFEDLFRAQVSVSIEIREVGQHSMVFLIDGEEAGRIPVFIEAPESLRVAGVVGDAATTALKKGSIMWLTIPQPKGADVTRPAWYVQQGQKLFVIKGGAGEQELPNLEACSEVTITVKSNAIHATIAEAPAAVKVIDNDSDEFAKIAELGMGTRLNLKDGDAAAARWKRECVLVELTPSW
ncbi:MAG: hypothetical protein ACJA2H_000839 [Nitriliruptoraceae bacterium]|jgi:hypothetical protein